MNISIMLLSVFLTSFGYAQEINCYTNLNQDMNCNTIDVQEEGVVDLLHPECDPEFPLQDYLNKAPLSPLLLLLLLTTTTTTNY